MDTSHEVIKEMEFFIGDMKTIMDVEVVDLSDEIFILGVDWIKREWAKIDLEKEILSIQKGNRDFKIPLNYIDEETDNEDEEEEEIYWLEKQEHKEFILTMNTEEKDKKEYQINERLTRE